MVLLQARLQAPEAGRHRLAGGADQELAIIVQHGGRLAEFDGRGVIVGSLDLLCHDGQESVGVLRPFVQRLRHVLGAEASPGRASVFLHVRLQTQTIEERGGQRTASYDFFAS